jgi:NADPH:quinone reductase-like Zn-dependent oxidoreductase
MKAIVYDRYGPPEVLQMREVPKPTPKDHEILVAIRAASVSAGDVRMRKPDPFAARLYNGLLKPGRVKILGFELAGEVAALGNQTRRFNEGDAVFSFTGFGFGAYAEFICLPVGETVKQGLIALKPANMSYDEAAAVPCGGLTALAFLRKGGIQSGKKVLVYGASGSVGTYAMQLARYFGAQVTGVCSTQNLGLVRSLEAEHILDYTQEDVTKHNGRYDLVFDAVGKGKVSELKRLLAQNGNFMSVNGSAEILPDDLARLKDLVEAGEVRAIIDRIYPLGQIVEAHRYVEAGHKRGNVVITIST